jgi:hypothetical protein
MVRIDENTNYYLYCIYEHGELYHACRKLELKIKDRATARDLITSYINKFVRIEDNKHPLLNLNPHQTRELIELLDLESKGIKTILSTNDGPSLW